MIEFRLRNDSTGTWSERFLEMPTAHLVDEFEIASGSHVSLIHRGRDLVELETLFILGKERHLGLATEALDGLVHVLDAEGADCLLKCAPIGESTSFDRLKKFYEKFGFVVEYENWMRRYVS